MTALRIHRPRADVLGARIFPYGSPDLKEAQAAYLRRALALACLIALALEGTALLLAGLLSRPDGGALPSLRPSIIFLPPPPSIHDQPVPQTAINLVETPPVHGVPIAVPDIQAPPDVTLAPNAEFNPPGSGEEGTGKTPVPVFIPEPPDPQLHEFVYFEELPEVIRAVAPVYPEIARQAGIEGTVHVNALVGMDGRVRQVVVTQSVRFLDDAAADAVRQWVFKPALCNNRPVKVWVDVPVRFSLR